MTASATSHGVEGAARPQLSMDATLPNHAIVPRPTPSSLIKYHNNGLVVSTASILTDRILSLSLADLCDYIASNPDLAASQIATASCYAQFSSVVKHRFVLLKIIREGEANIWLRMDRRMDPHAGIVGFVKGIGTTMSNDVVRALILSKNGLNMNPFVLCVGQYIAAPRDPPLWANSEARESSNIRSAADSRRLSTIPWCYW